jgi:hypothetical protein
MAKQLTRYSDFVTEWEHLIATVAANTADLAHLEAPRAKLQGFLDQVRVLAQQHDLHTANKQQTAKQLQTLLAAGKKLATFLRTGIKEHYGNRSEKLLEFGVPLFRRRKRGEPAEPEPPAGENPPAEVPPISTGSDGK